MNILYISHLHPPEEALLENIGGMQRVSMQLVDELSKKDDIELKSLIMHTPWKGIHWRTTLFLIKLRFRLPRIIKSFKPDVVLFSSMVTASLAKFIRPKVNVPMVTINHGQDVTMPVSLYQKFVPKIFEALDGVISVSAATRQQCIERGMNPEKGIALPNGFTMSDFNKVPDHKEAREELATTLGIDLNNKHLLLTVGRQVKRKGHAWFIQEVLPLIKSDVIYLVIGDGPEHENLKELVKGSEFSDSIILAGRQPDELLKKAYSAADLFMMPNIPVDGDMEGFGIVLLEANIASTPAVASDLEGIKDVISNGQNGYKVPVHEAQKFASKVDELINDDLMAWGEKSRKYVKENFSWNSVADQYISFLEKVIEKNASAAD